MAKDLIELQLSVAHLDELRRGSALRFDAEGVVALKGRSFAIDLLPPIRIDTVEPPIDVANMTLEEVLAAVPGMTPAEAYATGRKSAEVFFKE